MKKITHKDLLRIQYLLRIANRKIIEANEVVKELKAEA